MFDDWAEAIRKLKRGYWNLREITGLILAVILIILLIVFGLDWLLRLIF